MRQRKIKKGEAENSLNRRSFLKQTAGASVAAFLSTVDAEAAALPAAKITSIRVYEGPTVMPLQIPLLQSSMVVMIDTDIGVTGIGEGGTISIRDAARFPPLPIPPRQGRHREPPPSSIRASGISDRRCWRSRMASPRSPGTAHCVGSRTPLTRRSRSSALRGSHGSARCRRTIRTMPLPSRTSARRPCWEPA